MKTYYIVKHYQSSGIVLWMAHRCGILSALNVFNIVNVVSGTTTGHGADECEKQLRRRLDPIKPVVVRVVKI